MKHTSLALQQKQTIACLLVGLAGISCFFFMTVYSKQRAIARLDREIKRMEAQVEEQKTLSPLYQNLFKDMESQRTASPRISERERLERHAIGQLSAIFERIARKSSLELVDVIPNVRSLADNSGPLVVDVLVKGNFLDFRSFLNDLAQLSYTESLDEIRIQTEERTKELRVTVSLGMNQ
jgi:Tfp pilus assembly protein PilO